MLNPIEILNNRIDEVENMDAEEILQSVQAYLSDFQTYREVRATYGSMVEHYGN